MAKTVGLIFSKTAAKPETLIEKEVVAGEKPATAEKKTRGRKAKK